METIDIKLERLHSLLTDMGGVVIGYSGGVKTGFSVSGGNAGSTIVIGNQTVGLPLVRWVVSSTTCGGWAAKIETMRSDRVSTPDVLGVISGAEEIGRGLVDLDPSSPTAAMAFSNRFINA